MRIINDVKVNSILISRDRVPGELHKTAYVGSKTGKVKMVDTKAEPTLRMLVGTMPWRRTRSPWWLGQSPWRNDLAPRPTPTATRPTTSSKPGGSNFAGLITQARSVTGAVEGSTSVPSMTEAHTATSLTPCTSTVTAEPSPSYELGPH